MDGMTQVQGKSGAKYKVPERTALQVENYRLGTGLILNLHITHHGGTFVCKHLGSLPDALGRAPKRACNNEPDMESKTGYSYGRKPWNGHDETSEMISIARKTFHMIGWEFGYLNRIPDPSLNVTEWENPNLFSVLVMRDPMSRLLAASGWTSKHYPNIGKGKATEEDWWGYALNDWFTNNYALRVLAGSDCCNGAETDPIHLEHAKALVERFSVVLDIECLTEGLEAVADLLNITLAGNEKKKRRSKNHHHAPSRERIGYDNVYEYLLEKNKLDIELYEWSKNRALIKCYTLHS